MCYADGTFLTEGILVNVYIYHSKGKALSKILETEAIGQTVARHPCLLTITWTADHSTIQQVIRKDPSKIIHVVWVNSQIVLHILPPANEVAER